MSNFSTAQKPAPVTGVSGAGLLTPLKNRYSIEIQPFPGPRGGGCHWAVVGPSGFFWAGGCRCSVFEAAVAGFQAARGMSRAKTFSVLIVGR